MSESEEPITIRSYKDKDYDEVAGLFMRVNRELAPENMRERFEEYISTIIDGELKQLQDIFAETKRNAFWVVEIEGQIVGTFGIQAFDTKSTELRRMYLDARYRGRGIAQRMLQCAEAQARKFGFSTLILSTAEIQTAAIAFYRKVGCRLVRIERPDRMSNKTVGGGLTRFHFEKEL